VETCPRHCDPDGSGLEVPWPSRLLPLPRRGVTPWSWTAAGCRRSCARRPPRRAG